MRTVILITYFFVNFCAYSQVQKYNSKVIMAIETYAFLKGQSAALKKITFQFPSLNNDVIALENSSKVIFGRAERNIEKYLQNELDYTAVKVLQHRVDSLLNEHLRHPIQKDEYARNFLEKVRSEIRLSKNESIQKRIISFAYYDAPHQELTDGHIIHFTTKGHPKAEKSAIKLSIPKSWRAEEAELSTTVQQFTSHDGTGIEKILIMVHDLTAEDQHILFSKKSIYEMIPPQTTLIRREEVIIDGLPGIMIETEELLDSSYDKMKIRMLQFMFIHNERLYCLQGSIGPAEVSKNLGSHLKKYEPLFRLVAASAQTIH